MAYPRLIADHVNQTRWLVDALFQEDGDTETWFYVWDRPVGGGDVPWRWMRIGYNDGFGGALFHDSIRSAKADFAWIALNAEPLADPPVIYYERDTSTIFPPQAVLPLGRLRDVVLEWVRTGDRPTSIVWTPVNALVWQLADTGGVIVPEPGLR